MTTRWTEGQIEELGQLWRSSLSVPEIAKRMGFTRCSVWGRIKRLQKSDPSFLPNGQRKARGTWKGTAVWTQSELTILQQMWEAGFSARQIAPRIGRSIRAVSMRVKALRDSGVPLAARAHNVCLPDLRAEIEQDASRYNNEAGDSRFCAAMARAIAMGMEQAPLGVDERPCTSHPKPMMHNVVPLTQGLLANYWRQGGEA